MHRLNLRPLGAAALSLAAAALLGFAALAQTPKGPAKTKEDAKGKTASKDTSAERWKGHKTASKEQVKHLLRKTEPFKLSVGVPRPSHAREFPRKPPLRALTPLGTSTHKKSKFAGVKRAKPRTDLNGLRVQKPGHMECYLVDRGFRRHIQHLETYNALFRDTQGIVFDIDIDEIPLGPDIDGNTMLATGDGPGPVYLLEQGKKRWIASPAIMDKYYFAWDRIYVIPWVALSNIPDGDAITN
jgi:hypothetical protein